MWECRNSVFRFFKYASWESEFLPNTFWFLHVGNQVKRLDDSVGPMVTAIALYGKGLMPYHLYSRF